jgi:hypothetical protein
VYQREQSQLSPKQRSESAATETLPWCRTILNNAISIKYHLSSTVFILLFSEKADSSVKVYTIMLFIFYRSALSTYFLTPVFDAFVINVTYIKTLSKTIHVV